MTNVDCGYAIHHDSFDVLDSFLTRLHSARSGLSVPPIRKLTIADYDEACNFLDLLIPKHLLVFVKTNPTERH